ncbi:MAG: tRNA 2-thiouridine(34) synthase MnmA [Acidobacteriota bacterium]
MRVAVAMSGGVDSSVAASILVEQGYNVVCLTMRLLDLKGEEGGAPRCCSPKDIGDARRVAAQLGIPAYVIDMREEFRKRIGEYFFSSYLQGKTPNPCILCNSELKFGTLLRKALEIGADKIATGHYARIEFSESFGRFLLKRGIEASKDQAYFLFNLDQEQMARTIFPVGEMTKEEVREKARCIGLKVAEKEESQDICFSPGGDCRSYIRHVIEDKPGEIIDSSGLVLGSHRGIHHFTIGQRRGIGIAHPRPLYVLRIEPERNRVVVGEAEELYEKSLLVHGTNWISWEEPPMEFRTTVKIRSTHRGEPALVRRVLNQLWRVEFDETVRGIAPGQAAVFYDGDTVIGGGWISIMGSEDIGVDRESLF